MNPNWEDLWNKKYKYFVEYIFFYGLVFVRSKQVNLVEQRFATPAPAVCAGVTVFTLVVQLTI
jgi:hypothetical protein